MGIGSSPIVSIIGIKMKFNLNKNTIFFKNFCKIIKKSNLNIILFNCDKLENLNKYKNYSNFFNNTVNHRRLTYLIFKLIYYKNNFF